MIKNVKADSLADVFTDSTLSAFTQSAINKGVTADSIIYITCNASDANTFGSQYKTGTNWIWARGLMFGGSPDPDFTVEQVLAILEEGGSSGSGSGSGSGSSGNSEISSITNAQIDLLFT